MTISETIEAYDTLLARAQTIAKGYPFHFQPDAHDDFFGLGMTEDGRIVLSCVEYDSGYYDDPGSCQTRQVVLPQALLTMTDAELAAWRSEQLRIATEAAIALAEKRRIAAAGLAVAKAAQKEADDKREYERLKAKYERLKANEATA